jgi:N-sulfoglucosamine sulfohydrolase
MNDQESPVFGKGTPLLWGLVIAVALLPCGLAGAAEKDGPAKRLNLLLITADDMNYDSLGVTGCKVKGITPNLDRLAAQGILFERAHVTIAVCQPCRSVLMTGRYPHRNGALGFQPIHRDVPTLQESLRAGGYLNGIMAKVPHLAPADKFCWDTVVPANALGRGRDPKLYHQHALAFFKKSKDSGKPFFLMANSQDPHRPFSGSQQEKNNRRAGPPWPGVSRRITPVEVPAFLPDLPDVRREVAQYMTSVHRCDEIVGEVLRALKDAGLEESTLVMFLSDHGMAFPFAKTNCYIDSTRTPWMVRWPGKVKPGSVDREHFISGIDFMPTALEALGLPPVKGMDGRSFLPLLEGKKQEGRGRVFTVFNRTSARKDFPMRAIQDGKFLYIYNAWSDGKTVFRNESQSGLTFKAMQAAAKTDPKVAARVRLFQYRVPEELYDVARDPAALHNLIADRLYAKDLARLRQELLQMMESTADPQTPGFKEKVLKTGAK